MQTSQRLPLEVGLFLFTAIHEQPFQLPLFLWNRSLSKCVSAVVIISSTWAAFTLGRPSRSSKLARSFRQFSKAAPFFFLTRCTHFTSPYISFQWRWISAQEDALKTEFHRELLSRTKFSSDFASGYRFTYPIYIIQWRFVGLSYVRSEDMVIMWLVRYWLMLHVKLQSLGCY